MPVSEQETPCAARRAVTQADRLMRAVGSALKLSTSLLDNGADLPLDHPSRPSLDDVARVSELAVALLRQAMDQLEPHGLLPDEMMAFHAEGCPLWTPAREA